MIAQATEEYFDLTYSQEAASYYYLILYLGDTEAKALWFHTTKNLVTGFARYPFSGSLDELFNTYRFLRSEFKEVILLSASSNYLVSPKSFGTHIDQKTFELTNHFDPDRETLQSNALVNLSAIVTSAIQQSLEQSAHRLITHSQVIAHVVPFLEFEMNRVKQSKLGEIMFAHVHDDYVDIRAYKNNKLHLANSFFQSGKEDIAYFILYASDLLELDPEKVTLELSGNISIGDDSWNLLSTYWKTVRQARPLENIQISSNIPNYPSAEFDFLTYALLCAS